MDKKALIKIGAVVAIGAVVVWLAAGMFGGGNEQAAQIAAKPQTRPNPETPKQAQMLTPGQATPLPTMQQSSQQKQPMTDREMALMQMQQDTEAKYIAALEQLQMLLVQKDIANTNKDIANADRDVAKAKREAILAQKSILDALAPQRPVMAPPSIDNSATGKPPGQNAANAPGGIAAEAAPEYAVLSVTFARGRWVAVISSAGGKIYSVAVGDKLLDDGSSVLAIGRSGVTIEKDGKQRKLVMASVI